MRSKAKIKTWINSWLALISANCAVAESRFFCTVLKACTKSGICSSSACTDAPNCWWDDGLRLDLLAWLAELMSWVPADTACLAAFYEKKKNSRFHLNPLFIFEYTFVWMKIIVTSTHLLTFPHSTIGAQFCYLLFISQDFWINSRKGNLAHMWCLFPEQITEI